MTICKTLNLMFGLILLPSLLLGQEVLDETKTGSTESSATLQDEDNQESSEAESTEQDSDGAQSDESEEPKEAELKTPDQNNTKRARSRSRGFRANSKQSKEFIAAFEPVVTSSRDAVVRILDGKRQVALGTIVDSDGLILTKLSELRGELKCHLPNGYMAEPAVVGIDPDTDLVLLKVDQTNLPLAMLDDIPAPPVGSWLATVDQDNVPLAVGIVSHDAREIPDNELNSAVIGIYPADITDGDGVRVNRVVLDSPAELAGVLVNDVIIGIEDNKIMNRIDLFEVLSNFQPGDDIVLKVQRGDRELEFDITLGKRRTNPMMERGNRQNRLGSTLSKRRGDFPLALQHDSTLNANECGGPVVDLDGRIVGINIARDGRVSSLALPNEVVIPVIARLRSGEYQPKDVNKVEIGKMEKLLTKLTQELGDLPDEKNKKEIEFSAGNALEKELELQVEEAEERLKKLQARLDEKKKLNKVVVDALAELEAKQKRIERRREPLELDLKRLKTGVR